MDEEGMNVLEYHVEKQMQFSEEEKNGELSEFRRYEADGKDVPILRAYCQQRVVNEHAISLFGTSGWDIFADVDDPSKFSVQCKVDEQVYSVGNIGSLCQTVFGILDLDRTGRRWEGQLYCGMPWGWGEQYDSDGHLIYHGFMIGERRVCFGTIYYADIEKVCYHGMLYNGIKHGIGTLYNRLGGVEYAGEWIEDHRATTHLYISYHSAIHGLHSQLRVITLLAKQGFPEGVDWITLKHFSRLERIELGQGCLQGIRGVEFEDMKSLRTICIRSYALHPLAAGHLSIRNCPRLREITVERNACLKWDRFTLHGLPELQKIKLGGWNFQGCMKELLFRSLPVLQYLYIGELCFTALECLQLEELPCLESIVMGRYSILGTGSSSLIVKSK